MLARYLSFSSLLLALALAAPGPVCALRAARADDSSAPSGSPGSAAQPGAQIDPNFLLLPAYDLQWVNPPKSVRVGDRLTARLTAADPSASAAATGASGAAAALPKSLKIQVPPGTEGADDLPFSWSDSVTTTPDGHGGETMTLTVTPLKPGALTLPSLALADASGKALARTNPEQLSVASAIASNDPKPKEPDPPRPPVSLGMPVATLVMLAILALLVVAGVIFWLVRWSRLRRQRLPPKPAEPPKPEDEVALARLAQLERKGLLKAGQFKAHYFTVSEILKHYLGARYEFDAAESTTYEMLSHLEGSRSLAPQPAPQAAIDSLRVMFDKLDRVKFTDHVPIGDEGTELLEEARKLVITTRRPPPVVSIQGNGVSSSASR